MSDYRAIAGVSISLRNLLRDRMEDPVDVTIAPPDVTITGMTGKRLNLYLYQISENSYLKNQKIQIHGHPNSYGGSLLSLDLFYLFTAHGSSETEVDSDLESQYILSDAMRVLHDYPVISDKMKIIRSTTGTVEDLLLHPSLRGEFEQVKIVFQPLTVEDISKIWTTFPETNFRRSVAYQVSVVQIESKKPRIIPKLVGEPPSAGPMVHIASLLRSPLIREIRIIRHNDSEMKERPYPYARIDDILVISGQNFTGEATRVILGSVDATDHIRNLQNDRIDITIPDNGNLQPGSQSVEVVTGLKGLSQAGFHSNRAVFMLVPYIIDWTPDLNTAPRILKIRGMRLFHNTLSCETLVGRALISKATYIEADPTKITIRLPDTLPCDSVRCLVSRELPQSLTLTYVSPKVMVTIGDDGPHTAKFPVTQRRQAITITEAARQLEAAIRGASGGGLAFKTTRVTTAGSRLVVVPGGLLYDVTVIRVAGDPTADQLGLIGGEQVRAYLSGELKPFSKISARQPAVQITIGGQSRTIFLKTRPTTLAEATDMLDAAVRDKLPDTRVTTLEDQILIVPESSGNVILGTVPGIDETTVAELQLDANYPIRVRVNGSENIDDVNLRFPRP